MRWLVKEMGAEVDAINSQCCTPQQEVAMNVLHHPEDTKLKAMERIFINLGADQYEYSTPAVSESEVRKNINIPPTTIQQSLYPAHECAGCGERTGLKTCVLSIMQAGHVLQQELSSQALESRTQGCVQNSL